MLKTELNKLETEIFLKVHLGIFVDSEANQKYRWIFCDIKS
jgi:hypothetical protein